MTHARGCGGARIRSMGADRAVSLGQAAPGRSGTGSGLVVEALSWMARTGGPWRDLPQRSGKRVPAFRRVGDWRSPLRRATWCADLPIVDHVGQGGRGERHGLGTSMPGRRSKARRRRGGRGRAVFRRRLVSGGCQAKPVRVVGARW
ncbi:hypothetical protein D3272_14185 [Lichenibacterium ramalinae]|uniref:Transposase n=1 Tax=Lichenibacterium ramalinae TaxID=2316527 RepID=A0A4Q2RAP4_9HYPH|nr:hypothetical protein D3272_14185 [Lichenibacterium ramalinae]